LACLVICGAVALARRFRKRHGRVG
jgi:hypothetical protein